MSGLGRIAWRARGYTLLVALATSTVVLGFATVIARCAALEWQRDRMAVLVAQADQVMASAKSWSRAHGSELESGTSVALALDELLDVPADGVATVRRVPVGGGWVDVCEVRIERGRLHVTRRGTWEALSALGAAGR